MVRIEREESLGSDITDREEQAPKESDFIGGSSFKWQKTYVKKSVRSSKSLLPRAAVVHQLLINWMDFLLITTLHSVDSNPPETSSTRKWDQPNRSIHSW